MLIGISAGERLQFERLGFFILDKDSDVKNGSYIFNRSVSLSEKDKDKKLKGKGEPAKEAEPEAEPQAEPEEKEKS